MKVSIVTQKHGNKAQPKPKAPIHTPAGTVLEKSIFIEIH